MDCPTGFSCFSATNESKGCCLKGNIIHEVKFYSYFPALKPNETGCVIDDQCKRACESTHCDTSQSPSRCLCDAGRHFLFNKCCKFKSIQLVRLCSFFQGKDVLNLLIQTPSPMNLDSVNVPWRLMLKLLELTWDASNDKWGAISVDF